MTNKTEVQISSKSDYILIAMMAIVLVLILAQDALRADYEVWCIAEDAPLGVKYVVTAGGGITPLRNSDGQFVGCVSGKTTPVAESK